MPGRTPVADAPHQLAGHPFADALSRALMEVARRDTLAVLPFGAAKGVFCRLAGELLPGPTVVVSPAAALRPDAARLLDPSAVLVNGTVARARRREALGSYVGQPRRILLLAPDQLARVDVVVALQRRPPALLVVDDACLVADWTPSLRPYYRVLAGSADQLGAPRVLALCDAASAAIRQEVVDALAMRDPAVVVAGTERGNVWLGVRTLPERSGPDNAVAEAVVDAAADVVLAEARRRSLASGIVFVPTRRRCVELAARLTAAGLPCLTYHGGLSAQARASASQAFLAGRHRVAVATTAFGIDKPDVRFVVDVAAAGSVADYVHEIGLAGRDGAPARALLMTAPTGSAPDRRGRAAPTEAEVDRALAVVRATPGSKRASLVRATGWPRERLQHVIETLDAVGSLRIGLDGAVTANAEETRSPAQVARAAATELANGRQRQRRHRDELRRYAGGAGCRRRTLLELAGERPGGPCGNCDGCPPGPSA